MNKKSVLRIILDLVFLVVFNVVFFVAGGTQHNASGWIAYAFIHFAYVMIVLTPLLVKNGKGEVAFGFSIYSISTIYFIIEFITGLVFVFVNADSFKASLIVQIIISGIYAACLIPFLIANEASTESAKETDSQVAYLKQAESKIKLLIGKAESQKSNKEIEKAYDCIHASPSRANPSVSNLEQTIFAVICELKEDVNSNDDNAIFEKTAYIISLVEERNRTLRSSK